ncbi:MAG: polysaccharide biosynthesis protein [Sphingomonas bacterium]|nr:polysaccharide biosynthesis protein [Sphingomonas bacterium]
MIAAQLARGSMWVSASRGLVNLFGLVSTIALARLLVPADFGLVAIAITMLAILSAITNLSLAEALVQHKAPTPEHYHTAWSLGVLRGAVIGGLFALSAHAAARFYDDPRLEAVMYVLSFSVFLSGLTNPRIVVLQRSLVFWQDFVLEVSQKLVAVGVSITLAILFRNYWALVFGTVAGQLVTLILSYTILPFRPRISLRHVRELWSFSIWLTLGQLVSTINWRFDQLLIGKFLGRTALGIYTVGDNLAQLPTRESTQPLTRTLFPAFAKLNDDPDRQRRGFQRAQSTITAVALPLGVGVALVADPMVRLVLGERWLAAIGVIQALASIFALHTLGGLAQPLGMARGETRTLFNRDLQLFFIRLPFICAGMFLWGLNGVVAARVLTGLIGLGFDMGLIRRFLGLSYLAQLRANLRTFAAVIVMCGGVLILRHTLTLGHDSGALALRLAIEGGAGAILYAGSRLLIWRARGRPDGPETELARLVAAGVAKIVHRRRGGPASAA